jgi:hypothetical protein
MKPLDNYNLTEEHQDLMEEMAMIMYRMDKDPKSVNHWRMEELKSRISKENCSGLIRKLAREKANKMFKSRKKGRW